MRVGTTDDGRTSYSDTTCGLPCFKPNWLQRFAKFPYYMFFVCMNAVLQGMIVNGLVSTSISSIEKRFNLSSTKSGIFATTYDVAVFFVLVPLSYFAGKVHKGKWIGMGMILVGVGSILNTVPHFLDGNYSVGELHQDHCDSNRLDSCSDTQAVSSLSYPALILAQVFVGLGAAPIFTYGYSTIDELDSNTNTAKNMAWYMASATVGPAIAFIGGGQLLKIWGDIGKTNYEDLGIVGPEDPRWYGAWWIGFDVVGGLCIICAVPLLLFPPKLRDTEERTKGNKMQTHENLNVDFSGERFEMLKTWKLFVTNPTCMGMIAMQTIESFVMNGYITFVPKLFENLFGYSASFSSTITGAIVVPMGILGSILGGRIAGWVNNRVSSILKICMCLTISTVILSSFLLIRCPQQRIAGINHPYTEETTFISQTHTCNKDCHCETFFNPVCVVETKMNYLSPCHAACAPSSEIGASSWYSCGCVSSRNSSIATVNKGWCHVDCVTKSYAFFSMFALLSMTIFAIAPLIQSVSMRIVAYNHRDSYVCFSWLWMRAFGSVPGAILFGYMIDQSCSQWTSSCGSDEKCVLYSSEKLGYFIFIFTIISKGLCAAALFVTLKTYVPPLQEKNLDLSLGKRPQNVHSSPQ